MIKIPTSVILAVFLFKGISLFSQDTLKILLDKQYYASTGHGFMKLIDYNDSNSVYYNGVQHEISFPDNFFVTDTALAFNYFTGWSNAKVGKAVAFLIGDYKSFKPVMYVDYNHNLDFSDDGLPFRFNNDSTATVFLKNSEVSNAYFPIKFFYAYLNPEMKQQVEFMFTSGGADVVGNKFVNVDYWLADSRLNYKVAKAWVKGTDFTVVLQDYDCNGLFNDKGEDRIIINHDKDFSMAERLGSNIQLVISDSTQLEIGNEIYEIVQTDPLGNYIELAISQKEYVRPITAGSNLADFNINFTADSAITIGQLQEANKYVVLYSWGSWCKGCTQQLPILKELYENNKSILQIIGLNYGDSKDQIQAYVKEHNINWLNGFLKEVNSKALRITGYPNYILLDKQGNIILMNTTIQEMKDKLKELQK